MFCGITPDDVLHKISLGLVRKFQKGSGGQRASVDNIAQRFNQVAHIFIFFYFCFKNNKETEIALVLVIIFFI